MMYLAILLMLAGQPDYDQPTSIQIYNFPSVDSCAVWAESRRKKGVQTQATLDSQALEGWVLGFVTSYNFYKAKDGGLSIDPKAQGLTGWIDKYCADNPLDSITTASLKLVEELEKRKER